MLQRTAKSCGPDAPTLASSSRSRVGPTGLRQDISVGDGGKRARSPGRARRKPLKPLRAGTSGDSGVLVVTRVRSTTTKCTRGRGCNGHPAFPTPSLGERFINGSGAWRGEVANVCLAVRVFSRHCERSEAIHSSFTRRDGLLRFARNDGLRAMAQHGTPHSQSSSPANGSAEWPPCVLPLQSAHEAAGALGIRHSPRPLWAEDFSTPRAHGAARTRTCV